MLMLSAISEFFIKFWITMNSLLYHVATLLFEVFLNLASFKLVDSSRYQHIIQNFYVILGVVMLFILAFSILKAMINPDDQASGTSVVTKIVKNLVISTLILAVLPTIFTFAFDMQNAIIHQNTLGQLLGFGGSGDGLVSETDDTSIGTEANKISNAIFTAFLYPADFNDEGVTVKNPKKIKNFCEEKDNQNNSVCIAIKDNGWTVNYAQAKTLVDQTKEFGLYKDFAGQVDDDVMDFNYLLSLFGGLFLLYVIVSFCFDLGIRLVKLVFYQIIAPIPVFLRVVPNGKLSGVFDNWVKVLLTVYLEVFIRLLVVYFVVFICREVNSAMGQSNFGTGLLGLLTKAFVYMGLIAFMKQAPSAIAEVTGLESGNMKLGLKDKLAAGGAFAVGAIAGGAITAGTRNLVSGVRDIKEANKQAKNEGKTGFARARMIASATRRAVGSTIAGTVSAGARAGYKGVTGGVNSTQDMVSTASKGAKDAVTAREDRKTYRAKHGGHVLPHKDENGKWTTGSLGGHVVDTGYKVERWAGVNNTEALMAKNKVIDDVTASIKNIDATARDIILGDVQKNKRESYGITELDEYGEVYNTETLRILQQDMESLRGTAGFAKAQDAYDSYLKNFADLISNVALKGEDNWNNTVSRKDQASLGKLRIAANKAREDLAQNVNASFTKELENIGATPEVNRPNDRVADVLDANKDLDVNHIMLKAIKDEMTIEKTNNQLEIDRITKRNEETSSSGH